LPNNKIGVIQWHCSYSPVKTSMKTYTVMPFPIYHSFVCAFRSYNACSKATHQIRRVIRWWTLHSKDVISLHTRFTVSAGKFCWTVALVIAFREIFFTYSSIKTVVIVVTLELYNTLVRSPLAFRLLLSYIHTVKIKRVSGVKKTNTWFNSVIVYCIRTESHVLM